MTPAEAALRLIDTDRPRAHEVIFAHRHLSASPPAHAEVIETFHSAHPRVVIEAFRGFAKSTIGEESIVLGAALMEFKNCLVVGAAYERACERLESIGHEIEINDDLEQIFGVLRGAKTWTESKKILSNNVIIQAKGAGQSLRGVKYHDQRPDLVLIDDLEDEESVRSPEARREMLRWLYKTLIPALEPGARIRFIGNRLDPEAVIVKIAQDPEWKHLRFPIMFQDVETGEDRAAWPERFPLAWIYDERDKYARLGLAEDFAQEYMCEAEADEAKVYRAEHFEHVVQARVRTWEATYAMVDPARSVNKRSATTAIPVWSWVGNRLVVWDCLIGQWLPDEIIAKILWVDDTYRPVAIGVEEDALNQFILQPLRQSFQRHGHPVPIKPMAAKRYTEGRGKIDFIKSLQPFFAAGEVVFAKELPDLRAQFLSFPKGAIDGPNALAYAPKLRPGLPIYDQFDRQNVAEELVPVGGRPLYLAMNATASYVTAVLVQYNGASLHVIADWVEEGDPGQVAASIVRQAQLETLGKALRPTAPALHFESWSNVGLRAALSRIPIDLARGGDYLAGRDEIRRLLEQSVRTFPAVQVAHAARWTLNAFSGGYARELSKGGGMSDEAQSGVYKTLMEGLESFAALLHVESSADDRVGANYRETSDGRRYLSAMATRK